MCKGCRHLSVCSIYHKVNYLVDPKKVVKLRSLAKGKLYNFEPFLALPVKIPLVSSDNMVLFIVKIINDLL